MPGTTWPIPIFSTRVWNRTRWPKCSFGEPKRSTIQSDVTDTFDRKIEALRCHASQMKEFKHADPVEWLKERCREMAQGSDFELAEGFHRVVLPL
jgi:LmbE family N-acetylglucosaminyl deacetylase